MAVMPKRGLSMAHTKIMRRVEFERLETGSHGPAGRGPL
jgi:hypothetical protein